MADEKDTQHLMRAVDRTLRELDEALTALSDAATDRLCARYKATGTLSPPGEDDWRPQIRALAARRPALAKVFGLRRG
jgi:hypothetical protein